MSDSTYQGPRCVRCGIAVSSYVDKGEGPLCSSCAGRPNGGCVYVHGSKQTNEVIDELRRDRDRLAEENKELKGKLEILKEAVTVAVGLLRQEGQR